MQSRGAFFKAVWQILTAGAPEAQPEQSVAPLPQIQIHSNQLPPGTDTYTKRYIALNRERALIFRGITVNSFDKIPSLLMDLNSWEPLEDFVMPNHLMSHACNKNHCFDNCNPLNRAPLKPIPAELPKHFTLQQRTLLIETLTSAKKNTQQQQKIDKINDCIERLINSDAPIYIEFNNCELLFMKNILQTENPEPLSEHLQLTIEFLIRNKLIIELKRQRELFFCRLEKIKSLSGLLKQSQTPFECNEPNLVEYKSLLEKHSKVDILEIKYNLIVELSQFIKGTKAFILSVPEDKAVHQEEINRVLREEFELLLQQIREFKQLSKQLDITLSIREYEDTHLDILQALIVYPGRMFHRPLSLHFIPDFALTQRNFSKKS